MLNGGASSVHEKHMGDTSKGGVEDIVAWDFSIRTPAATPSPSGLSNRTPPVRYPRPFRESRCAFFSSSKPSSLAISAEDPEAQFGTAWVTAMGAVVGSVGVDDLIAALWTVAKVVSSMSPPELGQAGLDFSAAVHKTRVSRSHIFVSSGE